MAAHVMLTLKKGMEQTQSTVQLASSVPAQASQQSKDYPTKELENRDSSNASQHVLVEKNALIKG